MPVQLETTLAMSSSVTSSFRGCGRRPSPGFQVIQLFLQLRDSSILNFRSALEVSSSLRLLEFGSELIDLFADLLRFGDFFLFFLPLRLEAARLLFEIGELLLELGETLLAGGVPFFLERLSFHLELHDLALELVDFGGHRIELDL